MSISRRQLAVSLLAAHHIADRGVIAAFVADPATQAAPNPFAETSAGAVRQVWRQRAAEFQSFNIEAVGVPCLLRALSGMGVGEVLVQEILRAGPHTANVFHGGDGCRIVGAVLYGKPGTGLPTIPMNKSMRAAFSSRSRARRPTEQFDLFAPVEA
ncbi:hypothetical protein [Methylobacterium pseudosasicola]|uniref:Uncharacterized protein n=1 Tax=Methylobacterium pseudosasicola TaxID=582667 RepID=A0A1I4MNV0_9HYPH|nr:hypothetical protein [Methylobacterium pseudosasicola]SFM04889.1 hypothetical protein SAMN05192568_1017103 [Methylobacterium pseudosasicola]